MIELLQRHSIAPRLQDERFTGEPLDVTFAGELTPAQIEAAEAMLAHDNGVLSAATAFGKTVVGAWLIAARQVNTLVLVHRRQLMDQWHERLATFLDLPPNAIGMIGGGRAPVHASKPDVIIYDYADDGVPVLARMHQKRLSGYRAMGYMVAAGCRLYATYSSCASART